MKKTSFHALNCVQRLGRSGALCLCCNAAQQILCVSVVSGSTAVARSRSMSLENLACRTDQLSKHTASRAQQCVRRHRRLQALRAGVKTRSMRRTPSMNVSKKSKTLYTPIARATDSENDVALDVNNELPPTVEISPQAKSKESRSSFTVFGLQPSPELLSISMGMQAHITANAARWQGYYTSICDVFTVYFVQGILGLARLAISFFYKDEFHLDPATVQT